MFMGVFQHEVRTAGISVTGRPSTYLIFVGYLCFEMYIDGWLSINETVNRWVICFRLVGSRTVIPGNYKNVTTNPLQSRK